MKTAMIYWLIPEEIRYFVFVEDFSKYDGLYTNEYNEDPERERLLYDFYTFMYDSEGKYRWKNCTKEELAEAIRDGAKLIQCGFYL